jgi:hypothetical protein
MRAAYSNPSPSRLRRRRRSDRHRDGQIIRGDTLGKTLITDDHAFPHKVEVDLDMLHAMVLNVVGREVDDADVVTVDEDTLCQRSMKLLK